MSSGQRKRSKKKALSLKRKEKLEKIHLRIGNLSRRCRKIRRKKKETQKALRKTREELARKTEKATAFEELYYNEVESRDLHEKKRNKKVKGCFCGADTSDDEYVMGNCGCGRMFHIPCLGEALNHSSRCPFCRREITKVVTYGNVTEQRFIVPLYSIIHEEQVPTAVPAAVLPPTQREWRHTHIRAMRTLSRQSATGAVSFRDRVSLAIPGIHDGVIVDCLRDLVRQLDPPILIE